jgi:hypothetical protein
MNYVWYSRERERERNADIAFGSRVEMFLQTA